MLRTPTMRDPFGGLTLHQRETTRAHNPRFGERARVAHPQDDPRRRKLRSTAAERVYREQTRNCQSLFFPHPSPRNANAAPLTASAGVRSSMRVGAAQAVRVTRVRAIARPSSSCYRLIVPPRPLPGAPAGTLTDREPIVLELVHLSRRFGDTLAVDDANSRIEANEMIGVIGRSGAGKSTLLRLINRLIEPTEGSILADGVDVTHLRGRALREWRARTAMIFQQFNLVNRLDVLTNVLIGGLIRVPTPRMLLRLFTEAERTRAVALLDRLGLFEVAMNRADELSGGQQQRVAIARALMQEPAILLADEPIASLDPINAKLVMDALADLNQRDGITVICNLHTLDTARAYCRRVIGMAAGKIVFDGPPNALGHRGHRRRNDLPSARCN